MVRLLVANESRTRRPCIVSTAKLIVEATLVDSVTVDWPDGTQNMRTNVNANQFLTLQQTDIFQVVLARTTVQAL